MHKLQQQCAVLQAEAETLRARLAFAAQQQEEMGEYGKRASGGLAFTWVESALVQALRSGDWVSCLQAPDTVCCIPDAFIARCNCY